MKKLLVLFLVLGTASMASALPIITGPTEIYISGPDITLTVEGTVAEASGGTAGNSNTPPGGFSGVVWVDYNNYLYQVSAVSGWTSNVGGALSTFDPTYLAIGGGIVFTAATDPDWTEGTDVDEGAWFTFDLSLADGAMVGDTYDVQILDGNFGYLSSYVVTVVPEPITIALFGLGGLFLRRRK